MSGGELVFRSNRADPSLSALRDVEKPAMVG